MTLHNEGPLAASVGLGYLPAEGAAGPDFGLFWVPTSSVQGLARHGLGRPCGVLGGTGGTSDTGGFGMPGVGGFYGYWEFGSRQGTEG